METKILSHFRIELTSAKKEHMLHFCEKNCFLIETVISKMDTAIALKGHLFQASFHY